MCVCVRVMSAPMMSEVSFPAGTLLLVRLMVWRKANHRCECQTHTAFATPAMRHGASLGTRSSSRRRVMPSLPHFPRLGSLGLLCWPMTHEVIPHIVRRLILFCFHFCSLNNVDPLVSMYKINLHITPSLFL